MLSVESVQDLVFFGIGAVLALGSIAIALSALFSDRSLGRKRCPKCWYDMTAAGATVKRGRELFVCPECGRTITDAKRLFATRRGWRLFAGACVLMLIATQVIQQPKRTQEGWTSWIPSSILALVPAVWGDGSNPFFPTVLGKRADDMFGWQVSLAMHLEGRIGESALRGAIRTRGTWPAGTPIMVHLSPWRVGLDSAVCDRRFRLRSEVTRGVAECYVVHKGTYLHVLGYSPWTEVIWLPALQAGNHTLRFEIEADTYVRDSEIPLVRKTIEVPMTIVPSVADVLAPLRSTAIDAAIRAGMSVRILPPQYRASPVCLDLAVTLPPQTALGIKVDLLCAGRVVGTTDVNAAFSETSVLCTVEKSHYDELVANVWPWQSSSESAPESLRRWSIRVRGDPILSLTDFDAVQYWEGSVEVPLVQLVK